MFCLRVYGIKWWCQKPLNTKQVIKWSPGGKAKLTITGRSLVYIRTRKITPGFRGGEYVQVAYFQPGNNNGEQDTQVNCTFNCLHGVMRCSHTDQTFQLPGEQASKDGKTLPTQDFSERKAHPRSERENPGSSGGTLQRWDLFGFQTI